MEISRQALVTHPAPDMYRLVHDIAAYPQFLSWCIGAEVYQQSAKEQLASLAVSLGGLQQRFTTRNRLVAGERLVMNLVDGPFKSLHGEWEFVGLGDEGSKIKLNLEFEMSRSLVSSAFRKGFAHVADRMVRDFCRRADEIYLGGMQP